MTAQPATIIGVMARQPLAAAPLRELEAERLPDHLDRLFRAAYALCGSHHDAEDLVQETYACVLRKRRFLRSDDDLPYLMRALRNTWIRERRSSNARHAVASDPTRLEAVRDPRSEPQRVALDARAAYDAIGELPPPLRETIVAVDVAGLSYREAARALRVRQGTVTSRLFRAREAVGRVLEGAVE